MEEYRKSFNPDNYRDWKTQEVEEVFGIEPVEDDNLLMDL